MFKKREGEEGETHQSGLGRPAGKERTVWLLNSTVLAASTSQPRSCRGKLAALLPETREEKRQALGQSCAVAESLTDIASNDV